MKKPIQFKPAPRHSRHHIRRTRVSDQLGAGPLLQKVRDGSGVNSSIASRWAENTFKVALLLHVAEGGHDSLSRPFDPQAMRNALEIMDWFIQQHEALTIEVELESRKDRLNKLIQLVMDHPKGEISFGVMNRSHYFKKAEIIRLVKESKGKLEIEDRMTSKLTHFIKLGSQP